MTAKVSEAQDQTGELYKTLAYSIAEFDKMVVFIASGALGISFAFIEKVVELDKAVAVSWLTWAWYCFTGTILTGLLCHFVSIMALRWSIQNHTSSTFRQDARRWNWPIRGMNLLMIVLLIWGLWDLIRFVEQNLKH